ncbi:11596_t:CDS:2 [Racocetra fulgida]|uniref:11596_t:CDS:1 n=1 Tax=Racocetra fulgida TaxID=60492 RepID=A0A9N8WD95_9GLOM|nr:11596_t:CDS:2 [Racocetra fulgida]
MLHEISYDHSEDSAHEPLPIYLQNEIKISFEASQSTEIQQNVTEPSNVGDKLENVDDVDAIEYIEDIEDSKPDEFSDALSEASQES